jgi:AAA+ superfamily predicted ATPase
MHEIEEHDWYSENRDYLLAYVHYVKALLSTLVSRTEDSNISYSKNLIKAPEWRHDETLPALETLSRSFNLTDFEKMILVICTGAEIDSEFSMIFSKLYKNPNVKFPTFDIALRAFPGANWRAILPDSSLRRFQLISLQNYDDVPLITTPIRIQERTLHYLLGFKLTLDSSLGYLVRPVQLAAPVAYSARGRISDIVEFYLNSPNKAKLPIFNLWGPDADTSLIVAQLACEELGLGLWSIPGELIASKSADEQLLLSSLLSRECLLTNNALYIDAYDIDESSLKRTVARFAVRSLVPLLFLGARQPWSFFSSDRPSITIELKKQTKEDQRKMWKECFERTMLDNATKSYYLAEVDGIAARFNLDAASIDIISKKISLMQNKENDYDPRRLYSLLQSLTYRLTKSRLGDLAEEIIPASKVGDIILPASRKNMIQAIALHFKHRRKVYDEWGFAKKSNSRGLGIVALFSGESGTGKTMAAEAIANELGLDLYRIDLSMVASKYIGETEKNLRQIFDAAETKECILFFDEADSLFGKRSEVRDSHDRYANIQVGYLLQRIESYDGIVILATNLKKNLDPAFMRRLRFIIDFPFPDEKSREEIWRRIFPQTAPLASSLDFKFLSRLSITGGSIRNIALNAAFLAAEEGGQVSMNHIKRAAEDEYGKLGRGMSSAEIGNWPSS